MAKLERGFQALKRSRTRGDWIEQLCAWDFFVTLTFRYSVTREHARSATEEWLRKMSRRLRVHLFAVIGLEQHETGGYHVHVLIMRESRDVKLTTNDLSVSWLDSARREAGPKSEFKSFKRNIGGGAYVTKDEDYSFYVGCSRERRCRRRNCAEELSFHRTHR